MRECPLLAVLALLATVNAGFAAVDEAGSGTSVPCERVALEIIFFEGAEASIQPPIRNGARAQQRLR